MDLEPWGASNKLFLPVARKHKLYYKYKTGGFSPEPFDAIHWEELRSSEGNEDTKQTVYVVAQ